MNDSSSGGQRRNNTNNNNNAGLENHRAGNMNRECVSSQILAGMDVDTTLVQPDLAQMKLDRAERTHAVMKALDSHVASQVLPQRDRRSIEDKAATTIQAQFRGYCGRKLYIDKLYQQFEKEEAMRLEKTRSQVEEGQLLVENHRLEVQLDDNTTTRRNKSRQYITNVITIQRAWRAYKSRGRHSSCVHDNNNSMSPQPSESELSDTESVNGQQAMSVSTPGDSSELNLQEDIHSDIPSDFDSALTTPDTDTRNDNIKDGVILDYSEMAKPLRQHLADVDVCSKSVGNKVASSSNNGVFQTQQKIIRTPDETDEEYNKRVRKINYLSLAQEFAALKKVDSSAEPFEHFRKGVNSSSSSIVQNSSLQAESDLTESAMATPSELSKNFPVTTRDDNRTNIITEVLPDNNRNSLLITDNDLLSTSPTIEQHNSSLDLETTNTNHQSPAHNKQVQRSSVTDDLTKNMQDNKNKESDISTSSNFSKHIEDSPSLTKKSGVSTPGSEKLGDFDVYNIESTLPQLDWNMLEQQLQRAAEEERQKEKSRRNEREEIRRKLAMGVDEDYYGGERAFKKPNLQTRLQGGMNLQICFMNDATSDQESLNDDTEQDTCKSLENSPPSHSNPAKTKPESDDVKKSSLQHSQQQQQHPSTGSSPPPSLNESTDEDEDFFSKQARLQDEARLALAQAPAMAHMQLQVEKQMKKKSPIAEMVGIPGFGAGRHRKLIRPVLLEMNLAQLQVVVNDLHTQIESQNEDLVHLLVERDDLHMEQDSMLVDIEDLTRRAKECQARQVITITNSTSCAKSK